MANQRFPKAQRITHKADVELLFERSIKPSRVGALTLKTVVREKMYEQESLYKVLILAPKRNYKRAVDRNLVKRLLREAFRLNKNDYTLSPSQGNKTRLISVMYTGRQIPTFYALEKSFRTALEKAGIERLNKN